ncbi:ANTAR domain-containing protein [Nocardioides aurantiacus]|uniref:ANTAR domain-containing protein n=1 Tax=Nocardioides aurantiacus TaxID=86796 RepID=A0A3N2CU93_9ACTN|nr:ANTAR domain-containing protein [Nocardioides aurantiacus]ROR90774.1 ANTAR domain-containing protein [Nocardioides aurantiacus]
MSTRDSGGATPEAFGRWAYDFRTGQWTFDADLRAMWDIDLGEHGDVADVLVHLHPDDSESIGATVQRSVEEGVAMSGQARLTTRSRGERVFAFLGDVRHDDDGRPVALDGWSIDVTAEVRAVTRDAVDGATRHRRAIEQVKGALMASYRIDEVTAFAILRKQSNGFNVKINDLAEHVSRAMTAGTPRDGQVPPMMELVETVARRLRRAATRAPVGPADDVVGPGAGLTAGDVEDSVAN